MRPSALCSALRLWRRGGRGAPCSEEETAVRLHITMTINHYVSVRMREREKLEWVCTAEMNFFTYWYKWYWQQDQYLIRFFFYHHWIVQVLKDIDCPTTLYSQNHIKLPWGLTKVSITSLLSQPCLLESMTRLKVNCEYTFRSHVTHSAWSKISMCCNVDGQ